jgi:hypothetical protein
LERYGERRKLKADDILYSEGDRHIAMFAIVSGTIEATRAAIQGSQSGLIVVGGGNSAGQAAVFLSRFALQVHVTIRGDGLSEAARPKPVTIELCQRWTAGHELATILMPARARDVFRPAQYCVKNSFAHTGCMASHKSPAC